MKGILGRKVGMTTVFADDGNAVAVTIVEVQPNLVFGHRTQERDGYTAVQLAHEAIDEKQQKRSTKPRLGEFKKKNAAAHKRIKEFRVTADELKEFAVGSTVNVSFFKKGDKIDVTGVSRGHGFQGVMKRHHMKGAARDSSTAHELHRHPGAIGQRKTPGRVFRNKRLPGHMGVDRRTIQNLPIVDVIAESNLLLVGGSIPGAKKALIELRPAVK
jgi:large subunit ribosomal protein L3